MQVRSPHFLLFSEASQRANHRDRWRFVLQSVGNGRRTSAADVEPGTHGNRLELLAVVRGLESLDQPSRVTLVTKSRYVSQGIRRGLSNWRERGWRWERFGKQVPIRDHDLWQRIDRTLRFHQVECCPWHHDEPEPIAAVEPAVQTPEPRQPSRKPVKPPKKRAAPLPVTASAKPPRPSKRHVLTKALFRWFTPSLPSLRPVRSRLFLSN